MKLVPRDELVLTFVHESIKSMNFEGDIAANLKHARELLTGIIPAKVEM
jgi:hypothetical protein